MNDTWGDRVRSERQARGWSQIELARRARCGRTTITRIEDGYRSITLATAARIAGCFALPAVNVFPFEGALIDDDDEPVLAATG